MLQATFRPLNQWPGKQTPKRKSAPFRAGYQRTLDDLDREIRHLRGSSVVVQIDIDRSDIRNDGWPRSSARTKSPGVVVSFDSTKGPLHFACDTYDAWEDNLRAISLTMEALRAVDRYGSTRGNEQYKGFAQIEAPGAPVAKDPIAEARDFIWRHADGAATLDEAYRQAAMKLHPDRSTGSHDLFVRLQSAKRILDEAGRR
jgi:hypothetical protein